MTHRYRGRELSFHLTVHEQSSVHSFNVYEAPAMFQAHGMRQRFKETRSLPLWVSHLSVLHQRRGCLFPGGATRGVDRWEHRTWSRKPGSELRHHLFTSSAPLSFHFLSLQPKPCLLNTFPLVPLGLGSPLLASLRLAFFPAIPGSAGSQVPLSRSPVLLPLARTP